MTKKLNEVPVDDDATQNVQAASAAPAAADSVAAPPAKVEKVKARDRRAKEKALLKDAFASAAPGTLEELEERRSKLRALIKLGKERGFLTYGEINDHLPDNFTETEAIEGIISTFNDMGVAVYEQAPDAETLLLNADVSTVVSDDQADEEAEVALSTVDSEFGRTTDPVRMYMREMGSTELLTRAGEIEIAKRIENGLQEMVQAIAACPLPLNAILASVDRVAAGELRIDELVDGLIDGSEQMPVPEATSKEATPVDVDDSDSDAIESDDIEEPDSDQVNEARIRQLTFDCFEIFARVRTHAAQLHGLEAGNTRSLNDYASARDQIQRELAVVRFTARTIDGLCSEVQK